MKHILMTLCLGALIFGMSSCAPYIDAGGYASARPGYYSRPGYVGRPVYRPGYVARPVHRPGYYSSNRPVYRSYPRSSPRYQPSSYRSSNWNRGNSHDHDRGRSYRSSDRLRTNTRVNAGPLNVRNSNFLRL